MKVNWLTQRFEDVPDDNRWLSARELTVLDKLHNPKRHQDWRLGRWTAKRVVADCLGLGDDLAQVEIIAADDGAPEIFLNGAPAGISVSISHSSGCGFCVASTEVAVGCDIEGLERRSDEFITDYFTDEESALCRNGPPQQLALLSTLIWSAKESVLKVLRAGLRLDTRSIEITLGATETGQGWQQFKARLSRGIRKFEGMWIAQRGFVLTIAWEQAEVGRIQLEKGETSSAE